MANNLNPEGLTFEEWLAAACVDYEAHCAEDKRLILEGWTRGQDPTEWRAYGSDECCHALHTELHEEKHDSEED